MWLYRRSSQSITISNAKASYHQSAYSCPWKSCTSNLKQGVVAVSFESLIYGCLEIVHDRKSCDAIQALSSISLKARAQRSLIIENTSLYLGGASNAFTGARSARKERHGIEESSTIGANLVFCECPCRFSCIPSRASSCTKRIQEMFKSIQKKTCQKRIKTFDYNRSVKISRVYDGIQGNATQLERYDA